MLGLKEAHLVDEDVFPPLDEPDAPPAIPAIRTQSMTAQKMKQGMSAGRHANRVFLTAFASHSKQGVGIGPYLFLARHVLSLLCFWHIFLPQS